ncbi:rhodanese-like domain-containing protein [Sulfurovum sp.]|uniref:rhodanese-like domain-containing protein n=1 Tax=Sulfurovum sp. TaxID=1969726 RepID=UPI0025DBBB71|nr:rhodanese-like domain-containing protein [Sulfurovum sp.]
MKKIILGVLLLGNLLFAELQNVWVTPKFLEKNIKIIDIRTPGEWRETGIVKGAYPIMFFNEQGKFNVQKFLEELNKVVKKDEPFALICRTGSRTTEVSKFLSSQLGYKVINLKGGMTKLMHEGYKPVRYIP